MVVKGTRVRMKESYKESLRSGDEFTLAHCEEFGECEGIVDGLIDYGFFQGPEVDVRWQPSNLRYGYDPENLEVIDV